MLLSAIRSKSAFVLAAALLTTILFNAPETGAQTRRGKTSTGAKKSKTRTAQRKSTKKKTVPKQTASKKSKPRRELPLSVREIRETEQRLADLGYWTGPVDGKFDEASRHALIAFQKVTGRPRTGIITRGERAAVQRASRPSAREGGPAHIEIDLDRQVLFFVDDEGTVTRILPVSTGSGEDFEAEGWIRSAITPIGRFTVMNKIAGWRKSALGRLYYPNYIIGGIAIHGYQSVPTKPASHGCIRIPMFAAKEVFQMAPVGTGVIVYEEDIRENAEDAENKTRKSLKED